MTDTFVLVAGATGDLGGRVAGGLVACGARVHAAVRPQTSPGRRDRLAPQGVTVVPADLSDVASLTPVWTGASCGGREDDA